MSIFAWLSLAAFLLVAIIHILGVAVRPRLAAVLGYVNISLHTAALILLLFAKASLEVLLLSFTASFLLYLICHLIAQKRKEAGK